MFSSNFRFSVRVLDLLNSGVP